MNELIGTRKILVLAVLLCDVWNAAVIAGGQSAA